MEFDVRIGDDQRAIDVRPHPDGGWWVRVDEGEAVHVTGGPIAGGDWALAWAGRRRTAGVHVHGERVDLQVGGRDWRATALDARKAALQLGAGGSEGAVITQMPGVVVRTLVAVGDTVEQGQPVIVVEAMKMENEFKAPVAGSVASIDVADGQAIESGTVLLVIEPD